MKTPTHYQILGVGDAASTEEIRAAYRRIAQVLHPDRSGDHDLAAARFAPVTEAYAVLSDLDTRLAYDRELERARSGDAGVAARVGRLVGTAVAALRRPRPPLRERPAADVHHDVAVDFVLAVSGGSLQVSLELPTVCEACAGRGGAPDPPGRPCHVCTGEGEVVPDLGRSSGPAVRCPLCRGRGHLYPRLCGTCRGAGLDVALRDIEVAVPARTRSGSRLRLGGLGTPHVSGGPAGDLVLTLNVGRHPLLRLQGDDLHVDVPVTPREAAEGVSIRVPTLEGRASIDVPAGAWRGRMLRLRERGAPRRDGSRGDFFAHIHVEPPSLLSKTHRELLVALDELEPEQTYPARERYRRRLERHGATAEQDPEPRG